MSTTTSTENSGLLDLLLPPFEKKYDLRVDVIPVGTGKALQLGRNGDVDIVFVHARRAEDRFVAETYGDYFEIGRGCGNFLSYGIFDLDGKDPDYTKRARLFKQGSTSTDLHHEPLDLDQINEWIKYSWYEEE
ncbi:unnamed protein product, partial [marine sediment metagenome]